MRPSIAVLRLELLPDSDDDWVLAEAEDWRLLRAAALEALAASLSDDDRPQLATSAARSAIRTEPMRETAHAALIEALQVSPSRMLQSLISTVPA